jgi:hypothetical protein
MSEGSLTPAELAVLFTLMVEDREVSNADLQARYGFTLTGRVRAKLNDLKLVSSRKVGRGLAHVLEEKGWARCRSELAAQPPKGAGTVAGGFFAVLNGLHRYLDATDASLADVFHRTQPAPPIDPVEAAEAAIREAYFRLAPQSDVRVDLAAIRQAVSEIHRTEIDAALKHMLGMPLIRLEAEENQQKLRPEDIAAEVRIGRRRYHFLLIERV